MISEKELDREYELSLAVKQTGESTYSCENYRQALAWLRVGPFSGVDISVNKFGYTNKKNFIYRGQSNSSWGVTTTLNRSSDPEIGKLATRLFEELSKFFINNIIRGDVVNMGPEFDDNFGECAAQHYGMETNLSDWTTLPEIAINFALDTTKQYEKGKVFLIQTEDAINYGLKVILPPPIVKRVYSQRGIFLDLINNDYEDLKKHLVTIEFKHTNLTLKNNVASDNFLIHNKDLLPENQWFESLKIHCKNRVKMNDFQKDFDIKLESLLYPDTYYHPFSQSIIHSSIIVIDKDDLQVIISMLNSLVMEYKDGKPRGNDKIQKSIESNNPRFFGWFYQYLKTLRL
jgi:hypothetical protein